MGHDEAIVDIYENEVDYTGKIIHISIEIKNDTKRCLFYFKNTRSDTSNIGLNRIETN